MKKSDANDNQPDGILVGFQSSLAERTRSEFFEFQQLDNKPKNFFSIGKCNKQNVFMMVFFVNSALYATFGKSHGKRRSQDVGTTALAGSLAADFSWILCVSANVRQR